MILLYWINVYPNHSYLVGGWYLYNILIENTEMLGNISMEVPSYNYRTDSRFVSSQWQAVLLCNDTSHRLGASLESALYLWIYILDVTPYIWTFHNAICGIFPSWQMMHYLCYILHNAFWLEFHCNLVSNGPINNKPVLVWRTTWHRQMVKPLTDPILFTDAYMGH